LLTYWDKPGFALGVMAMLAVQLGAMRVLLRDPEGKTPWYQGMGILFYISGMMIAAVAMRSIGG
jgi:chlorophyll synthase